GGRAALGPGGPFRVRPRRDARGRRALVRRPAVTETRIGCSGWNYQDWRNGVFSPPRLPARRWLDFYAGRFDTVEVNSTFYRLPRESAVANWVSESPAGVLFAGKMSRSATHTQRLRALPPS